MDDAEFDRIYAIMQASFRNIERRTYEEQKSLLNDPHYRIHADKDEGGHTLGFLAAWEFADIRFVEHLAVDPESVEPTFAAPIPLGPCTLSVLSDPGNAFTAVITNKSDVNTALRNAAESTNKTIDALAQADGTAK